MKTLIYILLSSKQFTLIFINTPENLINK